MNVKCFRRRAERGVALVVTLILLSVTLVMAIAFMAISRRSRNAANTTTDTATARLASEAALSAAQAQIAATVIASQAAAYDQRLFVSTNFQNSYGFVPGSSSPTNVNYDYRFDNGPFTADDLIQNIANLWILPRPPVFISTNAGGSLDFRYYLDLNRNGRFEDTGDSVPNVDYYGVTNGFIPEIGDPQWIGVLEHPDQPHGPNNRFVARYAFLAQPIANSLDLNYIHNQSISLALNPANDGYFRNEGVGSWELNLAAFLADLNTNQWGQDVGSTANYYQYNEPGGYNRGLAFNDALSLLAWRYNGLYNSLAIPSANLYTALALGDVDGYTYGPLMKNTVLPAPAAPGIATPWAGSDNPNRFFTLPSDFFDGTKNLGNFPAHLATAANTTGTTGLPVTYDRYTLYRLLEQLGTDSTADDERINLNYSNAVVQYNGNGVVTNITVIPGAETNCMPWQPLDFFSAAADRMLRYYTARWFAENPTNYLLTYYNYSPTHYIGPDGYGVTNISAFGMTNQVPSFGLTNIPVYIGGRFYYSSAVNRLLQLAANLYDASTYNAHGVNANGNGYPSVFKPIFRVVQNGAYRDLFISGYKDTSGVSGKENDPDLTTGPVDVTTVASANLGVVNSRVNIYGVPWIVGVKKYMPGFNQFYLLTSGQASRDLMVSKASMTSPLSAFITNQMYLFAITNSFGCSFWNPYGSNYISANLSIHVRENITQVVTNNQYGVLQNVEWPGSVLSWSTNYDFPSATTGSWQNNYWPATVWNGNPPSTALNGSYPSPFIVPFNVSVPLMTNLIYRYPGVAGGPGFTGPTGWQLNVNTPALPQLMVTTTNRLQAFILDGTNVIDYVSFAGPDGSVDLTNVLADTQYVDTATSPFTYHLWNADPVDPAIPAGTPKGVVGQILVSTGAGNPSPTSGKWNPPPNLPASLARYGNTAYQDYFKGFFNNNPSQPGVFKGPDNKYYTNTELWVQAPYSPLRKFYQYTAWQANDPLVHYLASDLNYNNPGDTGVQRDHALPVVRLAAVPGRSSAWGAPFTFPQGGYPDATYLMQIKDSMMWRPDNWDFPTYKYPTAGWLGRVHRGTPWQTVYLKATSILNTANGTNAWAQWTGDKQAIITGGNSYYYDAVNSVPVQDGGLFDLFTARLNENAARGTLSVNQRELAAWSAVLSGVVVLTNAGPDPANYVLPPMPANTVIQPVGPQGTNSPLDQIVNSINSKRANFVNQDGVKGIFEHVGDVLQTPELTERSPFLNLTTAQQQFGIGDELYEWLPQQVMGLLRVSSTPRYVVYCYGQTLRPAPNGTVLTGSSFNLVTNYQVTAESAARAVIRVDRHATPNGTNYTSTVESYNVLGPE